MAGRRADVELVERGLFTSRERARAAILAGEVKADGVRIEKAGHPLSAEAVVEVAERQRFVSRGGHKLEAALDAFGVDVAGLRAIDVGASTGGFTDCLLQHGASSVVALDVGYGQLAWSLRTDPRVTVVERTNVRAADMEALGAPFDIAVIDVSFIALDRVLPKLLEAVGDDGQVIALVKPQFEAGKGRVGKKGVVRDAVVHEDVLSGVVAAIEGAGRIVLGATFSPLKGPEGNIEFLVWFGLQGEPARVTPADVVRAAHEALGV
ncbi:MAG: TlyA family rRNA (cytidine-2'-O)-methyltransferase [Actinobacteria bacterium HGW-Actinobacteria-6]|nr:MAG: TlyA family rRNA (cytidine-2'-O)-methyltransferase [Actinobacteria bacterium HGW-Actinobacteria-6]